MTHTKPQKLHVKSERPDLGKSEIIATAKTPL